jgi:5-methylcytosine-specific restriction endonuclease McrA
MPLRRLQDKGSAWRPGLRTRHFARVEHEDHESLQSFPKAGLLGQPKGPRKPKSRGYVAIKNRQEQAVMTRPRKKSRGRRAPKWHPFRGKTTDELLQIKKGLEASMALIEAELADLAARQAAAEPLILGLNRELTATRKRRDQLAHDPRSFVLGGVLGLGHKTSVKKELSDLDEDCRRLRASMVGVVEQWGLGDSSLAWHLECEREDMIRWIWEKRIREVDCARNRWRIQEQLSFVKQLLRQRSIADEQKRREADRDKRRAIERAKISAYDGRSRDLTETVKKTLPKQSNCPYCGESLGETPHADHIYPVTKGGHSVAANMVLVCAACNLKKGSMTLRAFIVQYGLDREAIEVRLHDLGKDF